MYAVSNWRFLRISGLPEPTIQWFKNDVELRNRPGLTVSTPGGGRTSVYIMKGIESDSGRYTCVISNTAGRANSTADVTVSRKLTQYFYSVY